MELIRFIYTMEKIAEANRAIESFEKDYGPVEQFIEEMMADDEDEETGMEMTVDELAAHVWEENPQIHKVVVEKVLKTAFGIMQQLGIEVKVGGEDD